MRLKPGSTSTGRVSVYTFNEKILALHAITWAIWLLAWGEPAAGLSVRDSLALAALVPATLLMALQSNRLHRRIDGDGPWEWPPSLLVRILLHFHFAVFWILIAMIVALRIETLADVRLVEYAAIALIHAGKVARLALYNR